MMLHSTLRQPLFGKIFGPINGQTQPCKGTSLTDIHERLVQIFDHEVVFAGVEEVEAPKKLGRTGLDRPMILRGALGHPADLTSDVFSHIAQHIPDMALQNVENRAIGEVAIAERLGDFGLSGVTIEFSDTDAAAPIRLNDEGEALEVSFWGGRDGRWRMSSAQSGRFDRLSFWTRHCLLPTSCEYSQTSEFN
jgi:hypothetical protein